MPWGRERLPTPVFWPGEFPGLYSPWGCKESDMTERLLSFSGGSNGKESACQSGDAGLIPSGENPLKKEVVIHSSLLPEKSHGQRSLVGYSL